jgi:hypothetical protein
MHRPAHPLLTIDDMEASRIDGGSFDHEAHVYTAWLYLERYPVTEAIERYTSALKRLTLKLGVPGKYHETITWFFMLIIAERRKGKANHDWTAFEADNDDLLRREDNVLSRYYSKETLATDAARRSFVLPDRLVA